MLNDFWLCFVPLFVAVDALGVLPIFMSFIEGFDRKRVNRIIWQSVMTAMVVALLFVAVGKATLVFLGITIADFMVAGGALLFAISLKEILTFEKRPAPADPDSMGAVPIGVPLIVGPAVLTTIILLSDTYGLPTTVAAAVLNIIIAGVIFRMSDPINKAIGKSGTRAISKLASLILAAIGIMMIRKGVRMFMGGV